MGSYIFGGISLFQISELFLSAGFVKFEKRKFEKRKL
jgi:hypothetical protein